MLLLSQVYRDLSIEILLWLLGAFLLGYILRYILGAKWRTRVGVLEKDLSSMTAKANSLEADLSTAKYEKEKTAEELAKEKSKNADLYFKLKACEEKNAANEPNEPAKPSGDVKNVKTEPTDFATTTVAGVGSKSDDLKIVDGVGPQIEKLLNKAGIHTFAILAQTKTEAIRAILEEGGGRFKLADPTTWPKQAQMAAEGHWNQLKDYKRSLKGGRE